MRTLLVAVLLMSCAGNLESELPGAVAEAPPYSERREAPGPTAETELGLDARAASGSPQVTSLAPTFGPVAAGSLVMLTGSGFTPTTVVIIGAASFALRETAPSLTLSPTQLIVITPSFFSATVDLAVINSSTEYVIKPAAFTYVDPVAPAPPANPTPVAGDAPGVFVPEAQLAILMPAGRESSLDVRFQVAGHRTVGVQPAPVTGHFDGQSGDTVGYYDSKEHRFHLSLGNARGAPQLAVDLGDATGSWAPVAGDFAGSGVTTVGVFNAATGEFRLKLTNGPGPADLTFTFGTGSLLEQPFAGDWRGTGVATVGVYNALTGEARVRFSNSSGPADVTFIAGGLDSVPVVGDFDGDGKDSLGMFDRTTQQLKLRDALGAGPERVVQLAPSSMMYTPIAGHWRARSGAPESSGFPWPSDTLANHGIAAGPIAGAYLKATTYPNLRSLLIVRHGKLLAEGYFHGARATDAFDIKSCTKSVTSALYGVAAGEGLMTDFHAPISRYLPQSWFPTGTDARKARIEVGHLLTMTGGLQWAEGTPGYRAWGSAPEMTRYALDAPMVAEPGQVWNYNSPLTHLAGRVLSEAVGQDLGEFASQKLFGPLGLTPAFWEEDTQGYELGGGSLFLTPRDLARFGQLYLRRGLVDGKQLVPAAWVDATTQPLLPTGLTDRTYSGLWWTQKFGAHTAFMALGRGGQVVAAFPTLDLLIVFTSKGDISDEMDGIQDSLIFTLISKDILPAVTP